MLTKIKEKRVYTHFIACFTIAVKLVVQQLNLVPQVVSWVAVMPSCLALNLHTFTPDSLKIFSIFAMSNGNNIVPVRARGLGLDQQQSSYLHLCFQWLTSILIVQSIKCFVANPPKLVVTHCIGMSQYYQWL